MDRRERMIVVEESLLALKAPPFSPEIAFFPSWRQNTSVPASRFSTWILYCGLRRMDIF